MLREYDKVARQCAEEKADLHCFTSRLIHGHWPVVAGGWLSRRRISAVSILLPAVPLRLDILLAKLEIAQQTLGGFPLADCGVQQHGLAGHLS